MMSQVSRCSFICCPVLLSALSSRSGLAGAASSGRFYAAAAASEPHITNIWCVGRNYAEHIKELGNEADLANGPPKHPMIFLKAGSSVLPSGHPLVLPAWSKSVHHEVELAVQLGPELQPVRAAVALDMTLRDVQMRLPALPLIRHPRLRLLGILYTCPDDKLKKAGHPWTLAKSYKGSSPLGTWFSLTGTGPGQQLDLQDLELQVAVNGKIRQQDSTSKMLFKVDKLLAYIRERFPVVPGDIVLTGTPHGVSALVHGDRVEAQVRSSQGAVLSVGRWSAVNEGATS